MLDHHAADRLHLQLAQLPKLITLAHLALLPGSAPAGPRVSGATREAPLPCRADILSLLGPTSTGGQLHADDQAEHPNVRAVIGWARHVIAARQQANDWTGWVRPAYAMERETPVSVAIRYLLLHHYWTVRQEFAAGLADDVRQLHSALNRATGEPLLTRLHRTVCPRCQGLTVQEQADGRLSCADPDCAIVVTRDEYEARAVRVLEEIAAA